MFNVSVEMSLIKEGKSVRTGKGRPSTSVERAFIAKKKGGQLLLSQTHLLEQIAMTIFRV